MRELRLRGYRLIEAATGATRWRAGQARRPDLVLLDLGLPDMDGLDIIRRMRAEAATPIVILSGRYEEREKVEALERGADDYVTKPFGVDELNARPACGAAPCGRARRRRGGPITIGSLVLDAARHEVTVAGQPVDLTPREFEILRVLVNHAGRLVTKGRLLRAVWATPIRTKRRTSTCTSASCGESSPTPIRRARLRNLIVTEPGVGYRIREPGP